MTVDDQAIVQEQLRQALDAFQKLQTLVLDAHRRLKGLPPAQVEAFWNGQGRRIDATLRSSAMQVEAAFKAFSATGQVASAKDRHLVTEARRYLAEGP
ncbi:hypothetical protein [Teichococcus oryzae]|uniref:Uncharacterized protein n=1 Tax=Teichococcus oryzae TaxID=1608942 RepID=A0A5B2TBA7_9PROT|nr:hypothetical protein [Pseudoroseomonas oryzae]KAA2211459.1 hypothetical protein F0Q34_20030 [Pseudoroseomonas oryzae]